MPTIDMAVSMRNLSMHRDEREALASRLPHTAPDHIDGKNTSLGMLHNALYFSMITTFAQGMALLKAASNEYNYQLPLDEVARIWTGGCIIRAKVLEPIRSALRSNPDLPNLMLDANLSRALMEREEDLRGVIQARSIIRNPDARLNGFSRLLGRIPQQLVACKSHSGTTRFVRIAYLRKKR